MSCLLAGITDGAHNAQLSQAQVKEVTMVSSEKLHSRIPCIPTDLEPRAGKVAIAV